MYKANTIYTDKSPTHIQQWYLHCILHIWNVNVRLGCLSPFCTYFIIIIQESRMYYNNLVKCLTPYQCLYAIISP